MRRLRSVAVAVAVGLGTAGCPANDRQLPPTESPATDAPPARSGSKPVLAAPVAADDAAVPLTVDMATPHFTTGKAAAAAARFALEDFAAARAGFAAARAGSKDPIGRARLDLMIAMCDAELAAWPAAAAGFQRALERLPLLADYIEYQLARALYFAHDLAAAEAHARKVSPDSTSGPEAELLIGDIVRERKDPAAIAAHYQKYLSDRPSGMRRAEASYFLAEAEEALGRARPDALGRYRRLTIEAPLTRWAERAADRISAILSSAPEAERRAATTLSAAEHIERGMVFFDNMRNEQSEAAFAAALAAQDIKADQRCVAGYHQAQSVFKQRNRTRAAPLFDQALGWCETAGNAELTVRSAYQAGRCYHNIGQYDTARARYKIAEERGPGLSYADDARLRQAEAAAELGDDAAVTELLSTIPTRYPAGDMKAEALWRLGWRAFKAGDHKGALGWLDKQIAAVPIDDNYWAEGQPQYWRGRALEELGDREQAFAAWEDAVKLYPLGYYALLSLNRLREAAPDRFAKLMASIAAPGAAGGELTFAPRAVYGSPGFARALELLRLGLGHAAEAELRRLGLSPPSGKSRVDDPDKIDSIWAMAFLYHKAGRYGQSHWVTRWHVLDYKRAWPVGVNRTRWEIAYPPGWWDLLDKHAKLNGYPTELLIAHVREESAFNPLLESFANAIGLTQMIVPTGKRFAKGTGITVNRESLRDPVKNVTIGARFLAFLWQKYGGRVALTVPSYNAGEGATQKWLKQRGNWPTDEWAEEIPYDETRNYAKRVLGSYFAYSYLHNGSVPEMPNTIPTSVIPGGVAENVDARGQKRMSGD